MHILHIFVFVTYDDSQPKVAPTKPTQDRKPSGNLPNEDVPKDATFSELHYMGKHVPSQSFKLLQAVVGMDDPKCIAAESRRRRRDRLSRECIFDSTKQQQHFMDPRRREILEQLAAEAPQGGQPANEAEPADPRQADANAGFDEKAYLSGQIPLISGEPRKQSSFVTTVQMKNEDDENKKEQEEAKRNFDEQAFLQGKLNLYGDPVFKTSKDMEPKEKVEEKAPWVRDEDEINRDLDEERFLRRSKKDSQDEHVPWKKGDDEIEKKSFDEEAFLRARRRAEEVAAAQEIPWKKPEEEDTQKSFDESAFLGRKQQEEQNGAVDEAESPKTEEKPFDENAFLRRTPSHALDQQDEEDQKEKEKLFNERAYLAGRIPLVQGGDVDPAAIIMPEEKPKPEKEEVLPTAVENYDESEYLSGKISILGGSTERPQIQPRCVQNDPYDKSKMQRRYSVDVIQGESPSWITSKRGSLRRLSTTDCGCRRASDLHDFYIECIALRVKATFADLKRMEESGGVNGEEKVPWVKSEEQKKAEEFDEEAFLKGRIPLLRDSVDKDLPPRQADEGRPPLPDKKDPRRYRKRAPWEKDDPEIDSGACSDADFSEDTFLARGSNGVANRSRSASREVETLMNGDEPPKRTFVVLRRSQSRDGITSTSISRSSTPFSQSGAESADESAAESDGEAIKNLYYVGKKIPSKTFSRLQMLTNRRSSDPRKPPSADPIERLKEKAKEGDTFNVDSAMEKLDIEKHEPDKYLEILKESLQQQSDMSVTVEAESEITDF
ncbi:hypothetical protein CAPTEDRAFT_224947 [Capitella teleta]|uniref:Uncharacterized protein n=1 Tax=Capitella teleta TaxID=283909 RepID=R7TGW9_CAPTE|nr:hypothetical protein CAPTEDRAFT_224947 [Capitella teleta]|eukprot:ELT92954.1 hypothetical protein CAPTEDRAFT_224947 [Capitella teleta]